MMKEIRLAEQNVKIDVQRKEPETYSIGDGATMLVTVTDPMIVSYADTYGDRNPIHLDDSAAAKSIFRQRIAHGMLSMNFVSTVMGVGFPGSGTILLGITDWKFLAPVFVGEAVGFDVRVSAVEPRKKGGFKLTFDTVVKATSRETVVMTGKVAVLAP